jgi:soluble lytic murein transglycosylase-like protein
MRSRFRTLGATAPAATSSSSILQMISNAAQQYGVPSQIATEVAITESNLNPNAVSSAGAVGVMQLMPQTAASLGVTDPADPQQNINGGVKYLSQLYAQFGNWDQALAAYNAGPGNVSNAISSGSDDWLSELPAETQNYVSKILGNVDSSYSTSITPSSVVSGATDVASNWWDNLTGEISDTDPTTLAMYAGLGVAAILLWDLLTD